MSLSQKDLVLVLVLNGEPVRVRTGDLLIKRLRRIHIADLNLIELSPFFQSLT